MDKLNFKNKKGITLMELIIYIGIFSVIFVTVISSIFYIQKIIQDNNQNYYIKNQIYTNLDLLQKYLQSFYVKNDNNKIIFYDKYNNVVFTQIFENNNYKNIYRNNLNFHPYLNLNIDSIDIEFMNENKILKYEIVYKDQQQKSRKIIEYLIVINQNM